MAPADESCANTETENEACGMNYKEKYELSMKLSRALADYLDGVGDYPMDYVRMPLAEYLVDEVVEEAIDDEVARAINLEHEVGG